MNTLTISNLQFIRTSFYNPNVFEYAHRINDYSSLYLNFRFKEVFELIIVDSTKKTIFDLKCSFEMNSQSHQKIINDNQTDILIALNGYLGVIRQIYEIYIHLDKMLPERIFL